MEQERWRILPLLAGSLFLAGGTLGKDLAGKPHIFSRDLVTCVSSACLMHFTIRGSAPHKELYSGEQHRRRQEQGVATKEVFQNYFLTGRQTRSEAITNVVEGKTSYSCNPCHDGLTDRVSGQVLSSGVARSLQCLIS